MNIIPLEDKQKIEAYLREDGVYLHLYEIGDLDDRFWPHSRYFTTPGKGPRPVLQLYSGLSLPCLWALTGSFSSPMKDLLRAALPLLPQEVYAHLSEGLTSIVEEKYRIEPHGLYFRMGLKNRSRLERINDPRVISLSEENVPELLELYDQSYPGHWFEPHMLQTGYYYGVRIDEKLVSASGIHVYSPKYKVAALGNIVTHPAFRGKGLASAACARLCLDLLDSVEHIGLNVKADNLGAIRCYQRLGFEQVAVYHECLLQRIPARGGARR